MQRQEQERRQQTVESSGRDAITHADRLNHLAMLNETTSNQLSRVLDARLGAMSQGFEGLVQDMIQERSDNNSRFRWLVGLACLIVALS